MATRRTQPAAPARRPAARSPASSIIERAKAEHERQDEIAAARRDQAGIPFRYWLEPGDSEQIVIVDDEPSFVRHEHNLRNPQSGKWDMFTSCIAEHANCPVCRVAERPAYFAMYFTIIDLKPYETRDREQVDWSKKLLVVKPTQQKKLIRLFERHGTMRGMILQMTRDSEKDAAIGNDIEFVDFMEEDELLTYERDYVDSQNKTQVIVGHEPVDYETVFPEQTEEQLRAIAGGKPDPGSRADDARGSRRPARGGGDGWDDDSRTATRRPARGRSEPDDDQDGQDERPRGRTAARPAPARQTPTRRARQAEPEDNDQDPDDGAPPPRSAAPSQRRAPARRPAAEPEQAEETDVPDSGRRPVSMASRRAALRRG